jgi:hypothetical protein
MVRGPHQHRQPANVHVALVSVVAQAKAIGDAYFHRYIDDVRLYSRALGDGEILRWARGSSPAVGTATSPWART